MGDDGGPLYPPVPDSGSADATRGGAHDASVSDAHSEDSSIEGGEASSADAGSPVASFTTAPIDVGGVDCGASGTGTFTVTNTGGGTLAVTASTTGSAFTVTPTSLSLGPGASGMLTITASVPGSATAGVALTGSLNLFTNDPAHSNAAILLSATADGATIGFAPMSQTSATFPETGVGTAASTISLVLENTGNEAATVAVGAPSNAAFSLSAVPGGSLQTTLTAGGTLTANANFTPTALTDTNASTSAAVTVTGAMCGTSIASIALSGSVGFGQVSGWPSAPIDFGPVDCGGAPPTSQTFTLTNSGVGNATLTTVNLSGAAFATSAQQGAVVPAGGSYAITVYAPAVPTPSPTTPISATLTLETDADTAPHTVTLTEEPNGAILAVDTSATTNFGSFGSIVLLQAETQSFSVTNTGTASAQVTLSTGILPISGMLPFMVSNAGFTVAAGGSQTDSVVFSPTVANSNSGQLTMTATGPLCAALPTAIPLVGFGIGGGPSVTPTALAFAASCGGGAPQPQSFTVSNDGEANMNWAMSAVSGVGSAYYTVSSVPAPGLLAPGASALVTVTATAVPSPAVYPAPTAYAAALTITTDVPFDNDHVVTLGETPLGDQLAFSVGNLRFGQFPINDTTIPLTFTVTNSANPGSPAANAALLVTGSAASAYALSPASVSNLAPGSTSYPEDVTFDPTSAVPCPASIALSTTDSLCTALPTPIELTGTGTQGEVAVSTTAIAFGTDPRDPNGLVNCGLTGLSHSFTISNVGNSLFHITGLALGLGASSPYTLSGDATTLPSTIPIGATVTITITPNAIPVDVPNPNDPSPFTDTLTITTDAALDSPHQVALHMQARGAVILDTPFATTWDFGSIGGGAIGTFTNTITNVGNAGASVAFTGLTQPSIFGLQSNPTIATANGVTPIVGQFSPPSSNGQWSDQGTLEVTPIQVFCEPLPTEWVNPGITVSGTSNGNPPVTLSGTLTFPTTNCGSAPPAGQAITLTNKTNQAFAVTAQFNAGTFYTLQNPSLNDGGVWTSDAGPAKLPGNGTAMIVVTPNNVTPGAGVLSGSAPYADDLIITIDSLESLAPDAGETGDGGDGGVPPVLTFVVPISWGLNGAVLSLPQGLGPNRDGSGNLFYPADTESGFTLPMVNSGTGTASVSFGVNPPNAFTFSPAAPITVEPGIEAYPVLSAASSDAVCPATTVGTATFLYSGPVCQPFPYSQVTIESCVGTY